ncbi:MAG TPA: NAD(P)/FAD-dependent oxidoreductase [Longimicrobiales bacterium]
MYDVIVVGARCAGAPTAMLLARRGYRVLLVDRATFPSDTLSSHFIKPPGVALLRQWGLLGHVVASGCPSVARFRFDYGAVALAGSPPPLDGVVESYAPRRTVLDSILVAAAARAGVEVRPAFTVEEVLADGGQVIGIRGHTRGGVTATERARLVVGADGRHSLVARAVAAPAYRAHAALTCAYYTYWSDVPLEEFEGYYPERRVILVFPTNDGQVCTTVEWPHAEFGAVRTDVEGQFWATVAQVPRLAERLRAGRRAARVAGTGDLANFFRTPYGPGWALVGDAGYHKDPLTAQGISDAFRDAQLLAEAIDAGLSCRQPIVEALADYHRRRDEAAMAMYELTCQRAALDMPPVPQMSQLLAGLRGNQTDTDRFIGVILGTVPIPDFFAPTNLERIMSAASTSA